MLSLQRERVISGSLIGLPSSRKNRCSWLILPAATYFARSELGSIGRNLNQIARAANQGQLVTSPRRDDLAAMLRVCGTLRDSVKRVLLANLKSWERGSL